MDKDFVLLQLLSSRLCHDLIGPVGSLSFSMEMLKEDDELENKEAFDIATSSVNSLVNRLNYFRVAFGTSNLPEKEIGVIKAKELIFNLFKEKESKINWNESIDESLFKVSNSQNLKLLLNIFLIVFYAVQQTASIKILAAEMSKGKVGISLSIKGSSAKLGIDNIQALKLEVSPQDLTPRNVQSYFTAILAKALNSNLDVRDNMQEEIQFAFVLNEKK